jgi:hypothetical protein
MHLFVIFLRHLKQSKFWTDAERNEFQIVVFWDVTLRILIDGYQCFWEIYPDHGGSSSSEILAAIYKTSVF